MPRRRYWPAVVVIVVAVLTALALRRLPASRTLNDVIDRQALRIMAEVASRAPLPERSPPFGTTADLEALTRPGRDLALRVSPLKDHRRTVGGSALVQERLTFASPVRVAHPESNEAVAYAYRHGRWGARPLLLVVPGQYLIDIAHVPMGWMVDAALERGVDVMLYVPPYHLDRKPPGLESGDAVLATELGDQLAVLAQELADVRALAAWMRGTGAPRVAALGVSLGGTMVVRLACFDTTVDSILAIMPTVELSALLLESPVAGPLRARLADAGWPSPRIEPLYRAFEAFDTPAPRGGTRVLFVAGAFDRVAPLPPIERLARTWNATLRVHPRGHGLLLLAPPVYDDVERFFDEHLR